MWVRIKTSFSSQVLIGIALGIVVGVAGGPIVAPLGKVGAALIQVIKALATPLLFFVLLDSIVHSAIKGKTLGRLLGICAFNALLAVLIGMGLSQWLRPGDSLRTALPQLSAQHTLTHQSIGATILGYIPSHLLEPFLTHSVPGAILLAALFGFALLQLQKKGTPIAPAVKAIDFMSQWFISAISTVVAFSPIAVFAVVASAVGDKGFAPLHGLGMYVLSTVLGMAAHVFIVYQAWILLFSKIKLTQFWKEAKVPSVYAFGVNSSLATLPVTLRSLSNLGVSPTAARAGAGLGTNFNNDGILLYEAMAVLIVAQAYGVELSFWSQIGLAFSCIVTSFGVAGVPEAGLVALSLVLASSGLPAEILPLLMTVDWIVARFRSATNVLGDMTVSIALDRFEGR
jgi:Na+/H+-dicarboxylate symporter